MAKPQVRVVLDKDALLKLLPEGEFESHIVFDNSVINLLNETVNRLVCKGFIDRLQKRLDHDIQFAFGRGWSTEETKTLVTRIIDEFAVRLIKEMYQKEVGDISLHIDRIVRERVVCVEKLAAQMSTPEAVEGLMVKACAGIIKGAL